MFYAMAGDNVVTFERKADRDEAVDCGEVLPIDGNRARNTMRGYLSSCCGFPSDEVQHMDAKSLVEAYERIMRR